MYNSTCRLVVFFSLASASRVSLLWRFSGGDDGSSAALGGRCGSLLFLHLSVGAGCGRFGGCLPMVLGWFLLLRHGGPCAAARLLSSFSTAALGGGFPCLLRYDSDRCPFNVRSMSWSVLGVDSCGVSNAWSCLSVLAGGVRSGFFLRCFFGLARRWSTPVVSEVVGWMCYVFSLDARVVLIKWVCTVPLCAI
jgi:hypothetical protein